MKDTLDQLEKEGRRAIAARARTMSTPSHWRAAITAAVVTPFLLTTGLIVPFFGQVLVLLAGALSVIYLWLKRSVMLALSALTGVAVGFAVLATIATIWKESGAPFFYLLASFCVFVSVSFLILIAGRIFLHYERAAERKESVAGHSLS